MNKLPRFLAEYRNYVQKKSNCLYKQTATIAQESVNNVYNNALVGFITVDEAMKKLVDLSERIDALK